MRNWSEICQKCADGEIEPTFCQYYGEPNGCSSPTYQEHPQVYNAAAMREALVAARAFGRDMWFRNRCKDKAWKEVEALIDAALAAPARNCDVGTPGEQYERFIAFCRNGRQWDDEDYCSSKCPLDKLGGCMVGCTFHWAQIPFAPAANAEGGAE